MAEVKQFGRRAKAPHKFMIDDDEFYAVPEVAAGTMLDLIDARKELRASQGGTAERFQMITDIFEVLLLPDSYSLFTERLRSKENPIGFETIFDVIQWMLGEVYVKRHPTVPSSSSLDTSMNGGASLTDGAPVEASTPEISVGTVS